ncbi:hypothetical protein SH528x_001358 [Novipirellula sp. SH528]|uniref:hypothetical protein n=1 Tax=Novipirellula sp. SH528 TaxID=3454466 RepID=UPI003F9FCDE8
MPAETTETLEDDLSEMFAGPVSVTVHQQSLFGDANLNVVTMGYARENRSSDGPTTTSHVRQSAIVLDESALDLPQFDLAPKPKGMAGKLLSLLSSAGLGGMGALDFPDTPQFAGIYRLTAWAESPVRLMFTRKLRDFLIKHPGWNIKGQGRYLVVFRHNEVIEENDQADFVQTALEIAEKIQQGEETLDAHPDLHRETRIEDVHATADRMGGLAGTLLKNQLRKLAVTRDQLETFLAESRPRTLPPGMKAQVLGNTLPVVLFGIVFLLVGIGIGITAIAIGDGQNKLVGMLMLVALPLVGGIMLYFAQRFRWRKLRVCRHGDLVQGVVKDVKRTTTTVNNQRRHHVIFEFDHLGRQHTATVNAYGISVKRAEGFRDRGESLRILVDPNDVSHILCPELLILWE